MRLQKLTAQIALLLAAVSMVALAQVTQTEPGAQWILVKRSTIAVTYPEDDSSNVDMAGTAVHPNVTGRAEAKRSGGRTRIKLRVDNLPHPQTLGPFYTSYVVWAISPEGQADNLGALPENSGRTRQIEVTTPYQTFGLIVTAEPHMLVRIPSPTVVAENRLRKDTEGRITTSQIEYRGDPGTFFSISAAHSRQLVADFSTPLEVLGARRAVEIARWTGADRFAESELRQAEAQLAALEQVWPQNRRDKEKYTGLATEVMRLAEAARTTAIERAEKTRLAAERRAAERAITQAQTETERAKLEAERAQQRAEEFRAALARNEAELAQARQRAEKAQTEAERAKANEEIARIEAERARLESERIRRERDEAMQRLQVSLAEILEVRREARGLIVSLSDVLFDFNKATLKPGAKERLSKLTGILLAYPGSYRVEIEGHTDSVGTDEYNIRLSQGRAQSVRDYLAQAALPADRIIATRGFGEARPIATNDTPEGRQLNRRVEIVISDVPEASVRR